MTVEGGNVDDQEPELDGVEEVAKWALRFVWIVGGFLAFTFAWLQIKNILVPLIKAADPVHLRRVTLIFYYLCWVGGSSFDVHVQKEVYRRDPGEGRMPLVAFAAVVMLLIVAVVLLWASSSDEGFAAALAPFVLTNIFGWRVILHRVTPMIETTGAYYTQRSRYFRLEQLKLVQWYMTGWWQWFRFFVMIVLVALANVICFSELARMEAAKFIHSLASELEVEVLSHLLPALTLSLFVLVAEVWIWAIRLRVRLSLNTMDRLMRRYRLVPFARKN